MQVDGLFISLSPKDVTALVKALPLPKGLQVSDVALTESGIEATVKASFLLGLPVKFKVDIDRFLGSKVFLKVSPPVKPNWLVVRPVVHAIPGAKYLGNSMVEVDLVSLSSGFVSGVTLRRLSLNKNGFSAEAASITSSMTWDGILSGINW